MHPAPGATHLSSRIAPRSRTQTLLLVTLLAAAVFLGAVPWTQAQTETNLSSGCTLSHDQYTCDKAKFEQVLAGTHTVAIETGPTDRMGQSALTKLIASLGKTVAAKGERADLTLLLIPIDPSGVQFSPSDAQIATLRIFAAGDGPGRGNLVWAENLTGPEDLQWFTVVNRLMLQFKSRFHLK